MDLPKENIRSYEYTLQGEQQGYQIFLIELVISGDSDDGQIKAYCAYYLYSPFYWYYIELNQNLFNVTDTILQGS